MINIVTALNNEKINKELNKIQNINIISKDIQYKEGIIELLEKNNNVQYIIINENISGQIKIEQLIKNIKIKNKKTNIIMVLNKKEKIKENYLTENKIKYIYIEELNIKKILNIIFLKNNIIAIMGNEGSGKTITTLILSEILSKNNKVLIIEDNIKNNSIIKLYKKDEKNKIIKIKNNLYVFNIKKILINKRKIKINIIKEINEIKNNYDYIFIDTQNITSLKIYEEIINNIIYILNSNILEFNKIKNIIYKKNNIKIILNNYNENSISEEVIKNIFNNKIIILEKIKYNKNYNKIINNNMNIYYLDKETKNKYLKIIEKIQIPN